MEISGKTATVDTASSSLRAETADQSCDINVQYARTYSEKVIPCPINLIDSFSKKNENEVFWNSATSINFPNVNCHQQNFSGKNGYRMRRVDKGVKKILCKTTQTFSFVTEIVTIQQRILKRAFQALIASLTGTFWGCEMYCFKQSYFLDYFCSAVQYPLQFGFKHLMS